jgi:ABC-2 type transport system ATP-binding protein
MSSQAAILKNSGPLGARDIPLRDNMISPAEVAIAKVAPSSGGSAGHGQGFAIEVRGLKKTYREGGLLFRKKRIEALRGISLDVQRGEVFGLLGPNGAGKTTLIKILLGVIRSTEGEAFLLGRRAGNRASRISIGYLPENLRIQRHHTGWTALYFYGQLSGLTKEVIRERGAKWLDAVGLAARAHDSIRKYSKGMLQRLGLAQALLHDPELLFLDEPTDGLDPVARAQVRNVITDLRSMGKTVFLNSHILQEVELVCDRVAIMDKGEIRSIGPVAEVTALPNSRFEFDLVGEIDSIRPHSLDGAQLALGSAPGRVSLILPTRDQAQVDTQIDRLRASGVSIVGLHQRKATLEEAFLGLVGRQNSDS